jgi:hypothetical protein
LHRLNVKVKDIMCLGPHRHNLFKGLGIYVTSQGRPEFIGTSPRKLKACRDRLRIPFCTCLLKVWVRKIVSKIMAAEVKKKCKK